MGLNVQSTKQNSLPLPLPSALVGPFPNGLERICGSHLGLLDKKTRLTCFDNRQAETD